MKIFVKHSLNTRIKHDQNLQLMLSRVVGTFSCGASELHPSLCFMFQNGKHLYRSGRKWIQADPGSGETGSLRRAAEVCWRRRRPRQAVGRILFLRFQFTSQQNILNCLSQVYKTSRPHECQKYTWYHHLPKSEPLMQALKNEGTYVKQTHLYKVKF